MKKTVAIILSLLLLVAACTGGFFVSFQRPYRDAVEESELSPALIYAVMKSESGFNEKAVSPAGAVGLMQLMPSTAQFVCTLTGEEFEAERLKEGAYNIKLASHYLCYLYTRFCVEETVLAAYNAGEGTVARWLNDPDCSKDGQTLFKIPYAETENYVKKVQKFKKFYDIYYH